MIWMVLGRVLERLESAKRDYKDLSKLMLQLDLLKEVIITAIENYTYDDLIVVIRFLEKAIEDIKRAIARRMIMDKVKEKLKVARITTEDLKKNRDFFEALVYEVSAETGFDERLVRAALLEVAWEGSE
ncbi:hypothetical protein [Pyrococcus kukulkanii]|uniref:hypothetical protein n=1 Tax=Pyrococcus kukulkanii TaxID=1609559 RepID=UPI00356A8D9B